MIFKGVSVLLKPKTKLDEEQEETWKTFQLLLSTTSGVLVGKSQTKTMPYWLSDILSVISATIISSGQDSWILAMFFLCKFYGPKQSQGP